MVTGERREVDGWGKCVCVCICVCDSHRQVPGNKARSVLLQVQRGRREGGRRARGRRRKRRDEGAAGRPLIPSNIPLDDRAWPKER